MFDDPEMEQFGPEDIPENDSLDLPQPKRKHKGYYRVDRVVLRCFYCDARCNWGQHNGKWRLFENGSLHVCPKNYLKPFKFNPNRSSANLGAGKQFMTMEEIIAELKGWEHQHDINLETCLRYERTLDEISRLLGWEPPTGSCTGCPEDPEERALRLVKSFLERIENYG